MFISEETQKIVAQIGEILTANGELLAVSENCCGGLISSYIVSVPGASKYFVGSTTSYALRSRLYLSGWSKNDILNYTGPSEEVALRLARNLKMELGASYTLAETGWAGPDDQGNNGKAFFGICGRDDFQTTKFETGSANRVKNMQLFANEAVKLLLIYLQSKYSSD